MKFQFVIIVSLLMPIILKGQSIESKPVILCGKIENYNEFKEQKTMRLIYSNNLHILNQTSEVCTIDDDGGFKFAFSRNMPQDVMIDFVTTFSIFVCPGDSIYFEFKASKNRVEIYESLEFHGDGVHNNNVIADFNKFYFKNRPPFDLIRDQQTNLSPQKYISFMENIRGDLLQYAEKFIGENSVSDTAKEWINAAIQMYYLNGLAEYPDKHLRYNKLNKGDWFVDDDYFDPIINCNVNETMLCNTDVSSIFVNRYHHNCINYLN